MQRWPQDDSFYKYLHAPNNFKTTYGTSYQDVETLEVSPAYSYLHEQDRKQFYPYDQPPYPGTRYDRSVNNNRQYQLTGYYGAGEMEREEFRRRFNNSAQKRDEYTEPPATNRSNYDVEPSFETRRRREQERARSVEQNSHDRAESMRRQYDPLVVEGPDGSPMKREDIKVYCHQCDKPNVCMNRLSCNHKFCDACLLKMHGSDNPFRDTIRWHYCCELCKTWTSEARLIRLDPLGRKMGSRTSSR